jgi:hypothetical protein
MDLDEPLFSGAVVELLQDWIGSPIEPPMEDNTKLVSGTRLRVFARTGDTVEVFILGQGRVYRIPARMLKKLTS